MGWYKTGTVSLTNGSSVVTGAGTDFIVATNPGEAFVGPNGALHEIASVQSSLQITLAKPYAGTTASGAAFMLVPVRGYLQELARQAAGLISTADATNATAQAAVTAANASVASVSAIAGVAADAIAAQSATTINRDAAAVSATNAASSASAASTSATAAATSASTATTKATDATAQATAAATSATNASASATSAVTQASTATTQASSAATSATNASASATTATTKASEASASATTASAQATTATTQATASGISATSAATSAATATTQAGNASTSATNAAASASSAASLVASISSGPVTSVNSKTGIVSLVAADVGLGNVNNTSDTGKPVSLAQALELAVKAPLVSPSFTGTVSVAGDISLTGAGKRILGSWGSGISGNYIQSSGADASTYVSLIPTGTYHTAGVVIYNDSAVANGAYCSYDINSTLAMLTVGKYGSGSYLPLSISTGGSERVRIDVDGKVSLNDGVLYNVRHVAFQGEYDNGNGGATPTVNFANGAMQKLILNANATATLSFPGVGHYTLRLIQDATGNRTFANPGGTKVVGAATISIKLTASSETILTYYYNGTTVYVAGGQVT